MQSKWTLLMLLPFSLHASEELFCMKGKIKILHGGRESVEEAAYCTNVQGTILVSESCHQSQCLKNLPSVDFDMDAAMQSGIGNPGFLLCRKLNGSPQIISFKQENKWLSLDRCILGPASHYVDTGYLLKLNWSR